MTRAWRHGGRTRIKLIIVLALAATVTLCGGDPRVSRGQTVDDVSATVLVSPLRARLLLVPSHVRVGGLVVGVLTLTNVSDESVLVLRADLIFDAGALRTLLHIGARRQILRPRAGRTDLWLMRAVRPGNFIAVASAAALTADLSTAQVESGAELLGVRPR